jgi:hypothetical protein
LSNFKSNKNGDGKNKNYPIEKSDAAMRSLLVDARQLYHSGDLAKAASICGEILT